MANNATDRQPSSRSDGMLQEAFFVGDDVGMLKFWVGGHNGSEIDQLRQLKSYESVVAAVG